MFICGVVLRDAFVFQRIFSTLIIKLDAYLVSAGIPDWLGCYFIIMLGSDQVLYAQVRMLWSRRGAGVRDVLYVPIYIYIRCYDCMVCLIGIGCCMRYSDDMMYKTVIDFILCKVLYSLLYFIPLRLWDSVIV